MSGPARRILGLTFDNRPIFEPHANASSIVYAAMGGGKTTCVALPAVQSMLHDGELALFINDVKNGEIAAQIGEMCIRRGRKFGVIDPFTVLGADYPYRIDLNPFGAAIGATEEERPLHLESIAHALIDEPEGDARNFYWRESPREFITLAAGILIDHQPRLATPGGLHAFLANPVSWNAALSIEANDEKSPHRDAARQMLDLKSTNPEHYSQHLRAAVSALKIFAAGPLSREGTAPDLTHEELIRDHWIVCFVNPVRYADRLGAYFAQHFLALMTAQLNGRMGRSCFILDEYCNAPLREAVNRVTVFRAFGLKCLYITQSRQDSVRKYGERETAILEENCTIKQWLKFSNFEEAERVSRAMGEAQSVMRSLGLSSDGHAITGNLSYGKEAIFSPYELMSLPGDEQIIHAGDIGFIHCRKIAQNQIAPTCHELAQNPLEGGRLPSDPIVDMDAVLGRKAGWR